MKVFCFIFLAFSLFLSINAKGKHKQGVNYDPDYHKYVDDFGHDHEKLEEKEIKKREATFKKHLKEYDEINNKKVSFQVGVNKFSDREPQEIVDELCKLKMPNTPRALPYTFQPDTTPYTQVPAQLDYRPIMPSVTDQLNCGSCYAHAVTAMIDGWYYKFSNGVRMNASPQYPLDCSTGDSGCNGGWPTTTLNFLKGTGLPSRTNYPEISGPTGVKGVCNNNIARMPVRYNYTYETNMAGSEALTKLYLYIYGPMVLAMDAPSCPEFMSYTGGILDVTATCAISSGTTCTKRNHAVVLVGYGTDTSNKPYWIVRNSWGTDWGEQGHFRVARDSRNLFNLVCKGFFNQ